MPRATRASQAHIFPQVDNQDVAPEVPARTRVHEMLVATAIAIVVLRGPPDLEPLRDGALGLLHRIRGCSALCTELPCAQRHTLPSSAL